jgi:phosphoribosylformimino-5-aminoimidazole carboxamide ribonucleotide (ProFAR) isomerase
MGLPGYMVVKIWACWRPALDIPSCRSQKLVAGTFEPRTLMGESQLMRWKGKGYEWLRAIAL